MEDTTAIVALVMAAAGLLTAAGVAIKALAERLSSEPRQIAGPSPDATGPNLPAVAGQLVAASDVVARLEKAADAMKGYATHEDVRRLEGKIDRFMDDMHFVRETSERNARFIRGQAEDLALFRATLERLQQEHRRDGGTH